MKNACLKILTNIGIKKSHPEVALKFKLRLLFIA